MLLSCWSLSVWRSLTQGHEYAIEREQSLRSLVSRKAITLLPSCPQTHGGDCRALKRHAGTPRPVQEQDSPIPSQWVLQCRGLAPAGWGGSWAGKGGQEGQRPCHSWRAGDELLVTRAEEEVSSCGLLSIGSRSWVCWSESPAPAGAEEWSFCPLRSNLTSSSCSAWLRKV